MTDDTRAAFRPFHVDPSWSQREHWFAEGKPAPPGARRARPITGRPAGPGLPAWSARRSRPPRRPWGAGPGARRRGAPDPAPPQTRDGETALIRRTLAAREQSAHARRDDHLRVAGRRAPAGRPRPEAGAGRSPIGAAREDSEFAALSAEAGVAFAPLAGGSLRDPAMRSTWDALFERGLNPKVLMQAVFEHVGRNTETWGRQFHDIASSADLVVAAGAAFYIGLAVAEALGLPIVGVALQPMTPTREFSPTIIPSARLPRASYRALHWLLMEAAWLLTARPVQRLRRSVLGLPAWPWYGPMRQLLRQRMPALTAVSPTLVPRPRDWPDFVHMTGFWYLEAADGYRPAAALAKFLEAGPPAVYVGFGEHGGLRPCNDHAPGDRRPERAPGRSRRRLGRARVCGAAGQCLPDRGSAARLAAAARAPSPSTMAGPAPRPPRRGPESRRSSSPTWATSPSGPPACTRWAPRRHRLHAEL